MHHSIVKYSRDHNDHCQLMIQTWLHNGKVEVLRKKAHEIEKFAASVHAVKLSANWFKYMFEEKCGVMGIKSDFSAIGQR
jgi:5,10-methenyltetrahydromethanopterin hydrogenase